MKRSIGSLLTVLIVSGSASADQVDPSVAVDVVLKTTQSWNGEKLPAYPSGQPEVTLLNITIPAGTKLPLHQHPVLNAGILRKGELTVTTQSGEKLLMKAGDPIAGNKVFSAERCHRGATQPGDPSSAFSAGGRECLPLPYGPAAQAGGAAGGRNEPPPVRTEPQAPGSGVWGCLSLGERLRSRRAETACGRRRSHPPEDRGRSGERCRSR